MYLNITCISRFGIAILGFHYTLSEVMLRGIKKKSYWYTLPWFLIVVIEEIVLFGLGVSHVTSAYKLYGYSYRLLFQYKGGFMVLAPFLTGELSGGIILPVDGR